MGLRTSDRLLRDGVEIQVILVSRISESFFLGFLRHARKESQREEFLELS